MVYIREQLPCKLIQLSNTPKDIEAILFELTLRKLWQIMTILILHDLNSIMSDGTMKNFCELYNLENLIKEPTCFKNPDNPRSSDVIN